MSYITIYPKNYTKYRLHLNKFGEQKIVNLIMEQVTKYDHGKQKSTNVTSEITEVFWKNMEFHDMWSECQS